MTRMENKISFGRCEASCIIMTMLGGQIFLNMPRFMMEAAWTAGWILTLYVSIIAFILFLIIYRLYKNFDGMDLIDLGVYIGGDVGGIITGVIIIFTAIFLASSILREFSENIKIISLNDSPLSFVMAFFVVGMVLGAYLGIEIIARFSAVAVPLISVAYFIIIIGAATYFDFSRITPILGNGAYEIFVKGISLVSIYSNILVLYMLYPFIKTRENFKSTGIISIILTGLNFTIGVLAFSLVYQYPTGTENFLPIYQLARLMYIGRFFERTESVFLITWVVSALLQLSVLLFISTYTFKKVFRLKYYRPVIFPFMVIIYTISFLPENLMGAIEMEKYYIRFSLIPALALPVALLLISIIKRKKEGRSAQKT
jgi:spore germination protein KB